MPTFDLIDRAGRVLGQVVSETRLQASVSSERARLGAYQAVPAGSTLPRGNSAGEQLLEDAERRLAEAFGRLGLSERATEHALDGRDVSPMDRARRERLSEAFGDPGDPANADVGDNAPPAPGRWRRRTSGGWSRVNDDAKRRAGAAKPRGDGWHGEPVSTVAAKAEIAGTLIRAGYDPADVARKLQIPIKHTGHLPVTVQGDKSAAAAPPDAVVPATDPATTTESARASFDSELVPLIEGEDRLEAALKSAFRLTNAEARHAREGRRR